MDAPRAGLEITGGGRRRRGRFSAAGLFVGFLLGVAATLLVGVVVQTDGLDSSDTAPEQDDPTAATVEGTPAASEAIVAAPSEYVPGSPEFIEPFAPDPVPPPLPAPLDESTLVPSGQLVISGEDNMVVEGLSITNPDGPCIRIEESSNITVRNSVIGPCGGRRAIQIDQSTDIEVSNSLIKDSVSGIYAHISSGIRVNNNEFLNAGRNFIQFDKVSGGHSQINNNWGENQLGQSNAEDLVNLFQSFGTPEQPIEVIDNRFRNGGPSNSGSGIMTGDAGGAHQLIRGNVLVNPGQAGIGIAGGTNITVEQNRVYSDSHSYSNVGIYVWNQEDGPCDSHTVRNNLVTWTNRDNQLNGWWSANNCNTITGIDTNNWNANLHPTIYE